VFGTTAGKDMKSLKSKCLICEGEGWAGYDINGNENRCGFCNGTGEEIETRKN